MAELARVYGVPITAFPEPLRSALQVVMLREWTGDSQTYRPSPLATVLFDKAVAWIYAERLAGRNY